MKKIITLLVFLMAVLIQPCRAFNKVDQQVQMEDSLNYQVIENQIEELESGFSPSNHLKSGAININQVDSTHFYQFNTIGDSVLKDRTLFTYDLVGRIKTELQYKWNQFVNRWLDFKYENTYDRSGKITSKNYNGWYIEFFNANGTYNGTYYKKDTLIAFPYSRPSTYEYNKLGQPLCIYRFTFDQYDTPVGTYYRCHYDSNGNKISIDSGWDNPPYLEEYTYDSNKTLLTVTQSRFTEYNYIALSFCTSKIKYEYAYDSANRVSNIQSYYFSYKANEWKYVSKVAYDYGDNGSLQTRIYSIMDTTRNEPVQANKAEYYYNTLNNISLKAEYAWNKVDNQWKLAQKEYYYYPNLSGTKGAGTTEISSTEEMPFKIFPNPAKDMLWIENPNNFALPIQICNVNGQYVKTDVIEKGINAINLFQLPKGIYIIRMTLRNEIKVCKFIVE